jgi:hypothetical protein
MGSPDHLGHYHEGSERDYGRGQKVSMIWRGTAVYPEDCIDPTKLIQRAVREFHQGNMLLKITRDNSPEETRIYFCQ